MGDRKLPERWPASLPSNDPRYDELRADLEAVIGRGKHSPAQRMLGEWALLGYAVWKGRIVLAAGGGTVPELPVHLPDAAAITRERQQVAAAVRDLGGFDE